MDSINKPLPIDEVEEQIDIAIAEESQSVEPNNKRAKSTTSDCWKFFTKIGVNDKDGKERAKCNACNQEYVVGGKKYGTSTLKRHIEKCKEIKFEDVGQMMLDMQGKLKSRKLDQRVVRELSAAFIISCDLAYDTVENREYRTLLKYLNNDFTPFSRNTCKADILKLYIREKEKLKEEMTSIVSRISLTSDLWTSCKTEGYITLTAHYVDRSWRLNSKILNFCHFPPPHTGFELAKKIKECLHDWGIEKKILCITLDNASANDVMQQTLKSQLVLQKGLLCDGEFFHVRCCAHILNLIVQEGLKAATDALDLIRMSIKYVRGSESRMIKFKQCIEKLGGIDASSGLCLDVPTRWNSTYLMLKSALKYRRAFESLHWDDENYTYCPSVDDWKRAEKLSVFLLPFYEITTFISGTSYPTSNLYFLQVWKIQCVLLESIRDEDVVIRSMAERMMVKFEKYWDQYSIVLAMGAVLDPRMKLESLGFCYETIDSLTWERKVDQVKSKMYMLFSEYSSKFQSSTSRPSSIVTNSIGASPNDSSIFNDNYFAAIRKRKQEAASNTGKNQLDVYLDEPAMQFDFSEKMDVLQWWKNNRHRFPELSQMVRDLLSIPITTVASESAFSIGSRILSKYRTCLLSENVEALMCCRNWLHGFHDDEYDSDEEDGKCLRREHQTSKGASNVIDVDVDGV